MTPLVRAFVCAILAAAPARSAPVDLVNWESPHVHPIELTPDGSRLVVVNTPDQRIEVFDPSGAQLLHLRSITVGVDPVTVRARTPEEVWVVNHLSDSISVVDLPTGRVRATIATGDEPCDVVFAGAPQRAFVSCSQVNQVWVFDAVAPGAPTNVIQIDAEDPRALAVSPAGDRVYAAVFESGNASTILAGGGNFEGEYPPEVVDSPLGPYVGVNPPPNGGWAFVPPVNGDNPTAPLVALIVKKDANGDWLDDSGGDWTSFVSGPQAAESGRVPGWDLPDRDLAVIDAGNLSVQYATGLMNLNMALDVNPADGAITVIGTDADNEIRFEPNLNGTFVRALLATVDPSTLTDATVDLNPHLDYTTSTVPQNERDLSLGTPRAIAWNAAGTRAWVAGMGSNNLVVLDYTGARAGLAPTVEVGRGPTGIALDEALDRLYVINRIDATVSVVDLVTELETAAVPLHDPWPANLTEGRALFYDTHGTSGLGHVSCASCHADGRTDRLAWDLGIPSAGMQDVVGQNLGANNPFLPLGAGFQSYHPMKGPMLTQTLQDVIGKEPLHWRGDRTSFESFNPAFADLLGDDEVLDPAEMADLRAFVETLTFPPNPHRELDNTLKTSMPLPGHYTTGAFAPAGQPLPNGNPQNGLALFRPPNTLDNQVACVTCHTLPTGLGTDSEWSQPMHDYVPLPVGPDGEHHHMVHKSEVQVMKVPSLRNLHERTGFNTLFTDNNAGFGYSNDGAMDSLERFVSLSIFGTSSVQDVADLVAFLLSFNGSDLPAGPAGDLLQPPGTESRDTHAAVGVQVTLDSAVKPQLLIDLIAMADTEAVGLIAKRRTAAGERGYAYIGNARWQTNVAGAELTTDNLLALAAPGSELTVTVVPFGTETRLGVDRDGDGYLDGDELLSFSDQDDAASIPSACGASAPAAPTDLVVAPGGDGRLTLTWTDASADEVRFTVERAPAGSGQYALLELLPPDTERFTDIALDCGTSYDYRVTASNCGGSGSATASGAAALCASLVGEGDAIDLAIGGYQDLHLAAGPENAGGVYLLLGSLTGTTPGFPFITGNVPLNVDPYLLLLLQNPFGSPVANQIGTLDGYGRNVARFELPAGTNPIFSGLTANHAYIVLDTATLGVLQLVSNPVAVDFL